MKLQIYLLIIFLITSSSYAQEVTIDSILSLANSSRYQSEVFLALEDLIYDEKKKSGFNFEKLELVKYGKKHEIYYLNDLIIRMYFELGDFEYEFNFVDKKRIKVIFITYRKVKVDRNVGDFVNGFLLIDELNSIVYYFELKKSLLAKEDFLLKDINSITLLNSELNIISNLFFDNYDLSHSMEIIGSDSNEQEKLYIYGGSDEVTCLKHNSLRKLNLVKLKRLFYQKNLCPILSEFHVKSGLNKTIRPIWHKN